MQILGPASYSENRPAFALGIDTGCIINRVASVNEARALPAGSIVGDHGQVDDMADLDGPDDAQAADPNAISPLTDEEADLFRYLRFGQMPPPIRPEDMVAEVDTRRLQPEDETPVNRNNWYGAGG